jgi:uncharacterized membrane protein YdjX (TVP38/TMEM64 family)
MKILQNKWLRLLVLIASCIAISFGLAYILQGLWAHFQLPPRKFAWLAYLTVFGFTLICNLTVIAPVPIATSMMIAAAMRWDAFLVALSASIGGAIGELGGYYAGYLGKKIAIAEDTPGYHRIANWTNRYGFWAIFVLALQPVLPFDIAGLVAGATRMPLQKFFPALWVGRFTKYLLFAYFGTQLIHLLPLWPQ